MEFIYMWPVPEKLVNGPLYGQDCSHFEASDHMKAHSEAVV